MNKNWKTQKKFPVLKITKKVSYSGPSTFAKKIFSGPSIFRMNIYSPDPFVSGSRSEHCFCRSECFNTPGVSMVSKSRFTFELSFNFSNIIAKEHLLITSNYKLHFNQSLLTRVCRFGPEKNGPKYQFEPALF